jgi:hypothetical protein
MMPAVSAGFVSAAPMLALGVVVFGFVVYCEVDLVRTEGVRHLPKWLWAIVCLLCVPIGAILYLTFGRRRQNS